MRCSKPEKGSSKPCELDLEPPKLSDEQREKILKNHKENLERARLETIRSHKKKQMLENENSERQKKNAESSRCSHAAASYAIEIDKNVPSKTLGIQPHIHPAQKRPIASPPTVPAKRPTHGTSLLWDNCASDKPPLADECRNNVRLPPQHLTTRAFRDGLVLHRKENTYVIASDETGAYEWKNFDKWRKFASKLHFEACKDDTATLISDGGMGVKKLGSGTYNIVVKPPKSQVPGWICDDCVYRMTRPDYSHRDGAYKYEKLRNAANEAYHAMFAALNDIGVNMHALVAYTALQSARTLRYGTIFVMERAKCDLAIEMTTMQTFRSGEIMAKNIVDLIRATSCCGVAFFDIKPGNVLLLKDDSCQEGYRYRLTDFDPTYFVITQRCWKSLMLLNLALFIAHTRNYPHANKEAQKGYLTFITPVVAQLIKCYASYDSEWLFGVASLCVPYSMMTNVDSSSTFSLQKTLCIMCSAYFYGHKIDKKMASASFPWETHRQDELMAHWRTPVNRSSWPQWKNYRFTPLIRQLLDFGLYKRL